MSQVYEIVIGLEVHLQFKTRTKIFCGCVNQFGSSPNAQTCPVCLGLPGSLPVFNKEVLVFALKAALALNCSINPVIKFDRKNYYYPDLPKAYQISQYDMPVAHNGYVTIGHDERARKIGILRAHLEEDAGKLIHDQDHNCSLVDYNRTGTPLLEIVSQPDIRSPQEAYDYLNALKLTLSYLDISDCDMENGSLRCDANISLRPKGEDKLGTKTEIKNLNSFRAVRSALEYETTRQQGLLRAGEKIIQETRLWREARQITASMRTKEEAHDYRYFSEPDLVPFIADDSVIEKLRQSLGEGPFDKFDRFRKQYQLEDADNQILIQDRSLADFFEKCTTHSKNTKKICHWINGPILKELNERKMSMAEMPLDPKNITELIEKVESGSLSNLAAKDILKEVIDTQKSIDVIIKEKNLLQVSDEESLEEIIQEVFQENKKIVEEIKGGKQSAIGFLVGQCMKKSKGKANPKIINEMIQRRTSHE